MQKNGFTLIEALIVIAIGGLLALIAFNSLPQFKKKSDLNSSTEMGVSLLTEARARTLAAEEKLQFSVYFQADRMVLFKGVTYATGTSGNIEKILPNSIQIDLISFQGGGTKVTFERLTGDTNNYGTIRFKVREGLNASSTVEVGETGIVEIK